MPKEKDSEKILAALNSLGNRLDERFSSILERESREGASSRELRSMAKDKIDSILGGSSVDEFAQKLEESAQKYADAKQALDEARKAGLGADEIKALRDEVEATGESFSQMTNDAKDLNAALKETEKSRFSGFVDDTAKFSDGISGIINGIEGMYNTLKKINEPWAKASDAASKYAKSIGMAAKGMDALRKNSIDNVVKRGIGINYNVGTEELLKMQNDYVKGVGRNVRIDNNAQENLAAMHAVMQGGEQELALAFENFGVSLNGTAEHAGKMFKEASDAGISFEKYSSNVAKNIKMAQNYTFKDGLKGLENMAKKAIAMKLDMQETAKLAEKIADGGIEAVIDTSAQLQVLGGPFASAADPMAMLGEGLNDMEALQDRIGKMVGGLGTFNKQTGQVEVSAFDKQRIRAAAKATGMDYSQLMESVNRQAITGEISKQLESAGGMGLNDKMQELVKNTATFENGKAGVSINGEFKELSELTNNDYEALIAETRSESDDVKQIAKDLHSLVDSREGAIKQKDANQAQISEKLGVGKFEDKVLQFFGQSNFLLKAILAAQAVAGIGNLLSSFGNIGKGLGKIGKLFGKKGGATGKVANTISKGSKSISKALSKKGGVVGKSAKAFRNTKAVAIKAERSIAQATSKATGAVTNITSKVGSSISNVATKASGGIIKGGAGRTAKRALIKTLGRKGATKALGIGAKLAGGIAKGGPIGIVGAVGNIATDALVASGKIKKGGTAHTALKTASTAAEGAGLGAMIGSVIPGIGTAVGACVGAIGGAVVGLFKGKKAKAENLVDKQLEAKGIQRQGKYSRRELKQIDKALNGGKMSDSLRQKLIEGGDTAILEEIKKNQKPKESLKEKISKKLGLANFTVLKATFGGPGMIGLGSGTLGKGLSKGAMFGLPFGGLISMGLNKGKTTIKGIKENGLSGSFGKVKEKANSLLGKSTSDYNGRGIKLDISGTIKLEGANGQQVDITRQLLNDTNFINQITELIKKRTEVTEKGNNFN